MKKIALLTSLLALTACGAYHNGRMGMNISNPEIDFVPMQTKVNVDTNKKITGVAECTSGLWIFNSAPERQTYGVSMQENAGNFASGECVAAAVYDAMNKSKADIIVAPHYTATRSGALCFGYRCLAGTTKVIVTGYAGNITSITEMDKSVVQEKQKNQSASKGGQSGVMGGLI